MNFESGNIRPKVLEQIRTIEFSDGKSGFSIAERLALAEYLSGIKDLNEAEKAYIEEIAPGVINIASTIKRLDPKDIKECEENRGEVMYTMNANEKPRDGISYMAVDSSEKEKAEQQLRTNPDYTFEENADGTTSVYDQDHNQVGFIGNKTVMIKQDNVEIYYSLIQEDGTCYRVDIDIPKKEDIPEMGI